MSITPKGLAGTFKSAADRRGTVQATEDITQPEQGVARFLVHDNDGGILAVTITQYKEPIR